MAQASAEKLEQTGPVEKERVASVPQRNQCSSTGDSQNMLLCSLSFKGSVRGPRVFFVSF